MTANALLLIALVGLGIVLLAAAATLVVALRAWREAQGISRALAERHSRLEDELERARLESSGAEQEARRLQERLEQERPEKLTWELRRATQELERLRNEHSESQRRVGQREQEWAGRAEQQEQQRLSLERDREHLMEELERWRGRYAEAQQRAERTERQLSDAQQKVEQLLRLKGRLLAEMQELEGTTTLAGRADLRQPPAGSQAEQSGQGG